MTAKGRGGLSQRQESSYWSSINTKWSILNHIYTNNKNKLSRLYLCIFAHKCIIITILIGEEEHQILKLGGGIWSSVVGIWKGLEER